MSLLRRAVMVLAVVATAAVGASPVTAEPAQPAPAVIAIVGEKGLNPAHAEFRATGSAMPALPPHQVVQLPDIAGSAPFSEVEQAMESGPLGRLEPGQLYRIDGTRLLVYIPAALSGPYNLISGSEDSSGTPHRRHGTGATGAAIGATHGTAPEAWAVFVATPDPSGYEWLAAQDWIDAASVSSYELKTVEGDVLPCPGARHVREFTKDRVFFASAGNSDHSSYVTLNTMPEFYVVGGVDADGNAVMPPRVPASADEEEIFFSVPYTTRTFETGDRYEFVGADHDSLDGTDRFGGTSGATPTTAGRAATIIAAARALLGDDGTRPAAVLAARGDDAVGPTSGLLADGDFTAAELTHVLHAVASPKLVGPTRYLVEGYGASTAATTQHALAVLRGDQPLPSRPDDDAVHEASEDARRVWSDLRGCV